MPSTTPTSAGDIRPGRRACAFAAPRARNASPCSTTIRSTTTRCSTASRATWRASSPARWWRRMASLLSSIENYRAELEAIGFEPPPAPRWNQDWFPRLDAAAAYAMVRATQPRRIVEVGSGHSTRFLARAVADGGLATRITAIDPEPRATLAGLDIEWLRMPVERVEPFPRLEANDILFIDSSHQLKPGNDVEFLL